MVEGFRTYLLTVAERALAPELKTKEGASDVVQETLVEAHRIFHRFEGRSEEALRAWLQKLLMNQVAHVAAALPWNQEATPEARGVTRRRPSR